MYIYKHNEISIMQNNLHFLVNRNISIIGLKKPQKFALNYFTSKQVNKLEWLKELKTQ